ncbi:DNA-binding transcriptional LysR family regulator [Rubricella aquisinus]|uniref:DNA-binding transcriptional LysR family regulator n=2 Tax=Rubricella aquisinus TaxID=2028108 RepID=A0A840WRL9_9RHOB|nr:DNA-binding transcriptional LysR family regulator [Rubricella aquisinus]
MAMRWDDLRVFLEVARQGQLLSAARALGMDAATVGRRIAALEQALDAKLFDRSPKGYALTEAGRRLLDPASHMQTAALRAGQSVGGSDEQLSGTVRIGAPEGVATYILAQACARLAESNPDLRIELVALPRVFSLSQREADLAVSVSPPNAGRLRVQRVADYGLHLYATPEIAARIRTLDDLRHERMVGYISDMIFDKELDYLPLIAPDLVPQLTSTSIAVQQRWALAGAGVGVLHDFAVRDEARLVRVLPEQVSFTRSFYLIRHEDNLRVHRISRAADILTETIRRELRGRDRL